MEGEKTAIWLVHIYPIWKSTDNSFALESCDEVNVLQSRQIFLSHVFHVANFSILKEEERDRVQ